MAKTISGDVLLDSTVVGSFTITYEDESSFGLSDISRSKTINITVYMDGVEVGSGSLQYEDLIASGYGGKRTITLTGNVEVV